MTCLVFLSFPRMLLSEDERVAVVSKIEGHVEVEHEAVWKSLTKADCSTKNYSVYNNDTIFTRSSSTADLFLNDNSQLRVKEDTILSISTRQRVEGMETNDRVICNAADTQKYIVKNINLQTGELWANVISTKTLLTEFETPAGVACVSSSVLSLIYNGIKTTLEVLDGLVAFSSKGNEILFEMKTGEKVNIFYPSGGRTSVEVKAGMIDIWTKFGNVQVEAGESAGVFEDTVTGEVTITAEIGVIEHKTNAGTIKIRESGSVTSKKDSMTSRIMVIDTDDGITITKIDGTTTRVAAGNSIGTLTENSTPSVYAALTQGDQVGMKNIVFAPNEGTEISIDKGDIDTDKVVSSDPVTKFTRNPKVGLIESTKNVENAAGTSEVIDSDPRYTALGFTDNSILNQTKNDDATSKDTDHTEKPDNSKGSLKKRGSSPSPSTNYLLDFARRIRS